MAVIKCPECKKEISEQATNCPNCGYPLGKEKAKRQASKGLSDCLIVLFLMIGGCSVIAFIASNKSDEIRLKGSSSSSNVSKRNQAASVSSIQKAYIPNLEAVDVYGNLTKKGFILKRESTDNRLKWVCSEKKSGHNYTVEIRGNNSDKIYLVEATALNYSHISTNQKVKDFLGYVASVPYENAKQALASNWVKSNIHHNSSIVISGIKFEIIANSDRARMLLISPEKK
ncbi:MAG: zinc ribbon domain-containing protein [Elusimicrobia bacterium]|nr:zinc ribbon domain-containing protein [Elusimicrobiota bacterium]